MKTNQILSALQAWGFGHGPHTVELPTLITKASGANPGVIIRQPSSWKKAKSKAKRLARRTQRPVVARNYLEGLVKTYRPEAL